MNYELIREANPVARKTYKCIWCGWPITVGEKHYHEISTYCGDFQDHRWHRDCIKVAREDFNGSGDSEFMPHSNERADDHRRNG